MDKFIIKGPTTLNGSVNISGSKNAALPIMTACLASPGKYTLNNVPNLRDTRTMIKLLEIIGSKVVFKNNTLLIDDNLTVLRAAREFGIKHLYTVARPDSQKPKQNPEEFEVIDSFDELVF